MQDYRRPDVVEIQQRDSDRVYLLPSGDTTVTERYNDREPAIGRFRSLRESIYHVNNPEYRVQSPAVHHRIPSLDDGERPTAVDFDQPTSYSPQASFGHLNYPPELWRPFWIRKPTLGVILVLFLLIVVGLSLLRHFSESRNGFDISTLYYAWTYAPVAFLVLVLGLWRQVDHYFKLLAPWDALRKGPVSASKGLLLDYVSPIHLVSFITALKRGYVPVVLSIIIFFALKVLTVFSAALFVSLPTMIILNSTSASTARAFDASSFQASAFPNVSTFTSDPVYSVLGNLAYGLPFETGVRADFAYIPVALNHSADEGLANATYQAKTEAMFVNLSCGPLQVTYGSNAVISGNRTIVNSTNEYIQLQLPNGNVCRNWSSTRVYAINPLKQKAPPRQVEGTMQSVYCLGDQEGSKRAEPAGLLFTVTDIHYTQTISSNGTITKGTRNLANISNMLCLPGYYILGANITNSSAVFGDRGIDIHVDPVQNRTLSGLSRRNLVVIYEGILNASRGVFGTREENSQALMVPNTVFNLMELASNRSSLEPFLDTKVMQTAAESTFRRIMAYYAAKGLTTPVQTATTADAIYAKNKLHVSIVPYYIMLAGAAVIVICTALLMLASPRPLVPKDPSLLAMPATILTRSPELNRLLRKQIATKAEMASTLSGYEFGSAIATTADGINSFKLVVTEAPTRSRLPRKGSTRQWWSPNFLLLPCFILAIIIPITVIVLLEFLQRRSDADEGLTNVPVGPYTTMYLRCIPVLLMLLIAATIEFLDFHVCLFSPWNKLARGNASAKRSLLSHLLGKLPPNALFEALQGRHVGAIFSIMAAVIASILAVVAAGLYSVRNQTSIGTPQNLVAADSLTISSNYNVLNDQGAAGVVRLVNTPNAVYPNGTFDDLVFPTYTRSQTHQNTSMMSMDRAVGPFTATLPAVRANLMCDVLPSTNINIKYVPASRNYSLNHYTIDSQYNLPQSCHFAGQNGSSSVALFRNQFNTTKNDTTLYGGQLLDLVFGANSSMVSNYGESRPATIGNNPAVGCPSLAFTFAELLGKTGTFHVTTLVCYQQIQQLEANVTYKANSTELDPSSPPKVIDGSTTLMANPNSTSNAKSFDWRIQLNVERQLYGLNGARLQFGDASTSYQFDAFFSYLLNNTYTRGPASLSGTQNQQTLTDAINTLYRKYMAQVINSNMRTNKPISNLQKRQSSPATVQMQSNTSRPRLVQNSTSKLILQIFLGLVVIFSIVAYSTTSFHRLLPTNPCSIAGTMSVLAGSDLCWSPDDALCDCCGKPRRSSWNHSEQTGSEDTIVADPSEYASHNHEPGRARVSTMARAPRTQIIPSGAEWMDHIKFAGVFAGREYSLGWWREDASKARRRRFGVDVGGRPDGENDDDWELGDRRPLGDVGFEGFMMKGREMLGDNRGVYQRTENVSDGRDIGHMPASGTYQGGETGPGLMSPRRVRFQDR